MFLRGGGAKRPPVKDHCFNRITLAAVRTGTMAERENATEWLLQPIRER